MKEQIVELRIKLDGLAQLTKELRPIKIERATFENNVGNIKTKNDLQYIDEGVIVILEKSNSKEVQKAYDSLILAKAWLGKILGELGEATPYVNDGKRKEVGDIEPTADSLPIVNTAHFWDTLNHIQKVDWLRCSIEDMIQEIIKLDLKGSRELAIARTNSYTHLCESKIHLGFELQRIRNGQTEFNVYI